MARTVVIGEPLVSLELLGFEEREVSLRTEERYLPQILVDLGFFKSKSEVRRNRPDLVRTLEELDFEDIKIGKKRLWLIVGK